MALATTSEDAVKDAAPEEDLEDGEIEDDDEEEEVAAPPAPEPTVADAPSSPPAVGGGGGGGVGSITSPPGRIRGDTDAEKAGVGGEKHKKKHLTEAEKSVMKLHKLERMEREKREKYRREQMHIPEPVDDYAVSLEKALAKVLKKDAPTTVVDEELKYEDEVKPPRARKRKKKDKHKKAKRAKQDSPKNPEDEIERRSPDPMDPGRSEGESSDTDASTDKNELKRRRELRRENAKSRRDRRDRSRERQIENNRQPFKKLRKRNVGICLYYLQGKCNDEHCQYSHDCVQPLKLELCKFYLLDCCAKGDKCLYMHSDFPCKYYHTGIPCPYGDDCKFAHGGPLADSVKAILFKHIETAPKEILGNFPRLSRENAHMMITQAQKNLELKKLKDKEEQLGRGEHPKEEFEHDEQLSDGAKPAAQAQQEKKEKRNRPSRWQDPEPESEAVLPTAPPMQALLGFGLNSAGFKDQDMRINSNGDVDMRSLHSLPPTDIPNPSIFTTQPPPVLQGMQGLNLLQMQQLQGFGLGIMNPVDIEKYKMDACSAAAKDKEKELPAEEKPDFPALAAMPQDIDLRIPPPNMQDVVKNEQADDEEDALQIVMDEEEVKKDQYDAKETPKPLEIQSPDEPPTEGAIGLPKVQRDLFARIQQQQKVNLPGANDAKEDDQDQNIDWYSDDEDDNKLTIEHDDDEPEEGKHEAEMKEEKTDSPAEPTLEPASVVERLGDLSSFDIAQVSKLLSTIKENSLGQPERDPRRSDPRADPRGDPRTTDRGDLRDPRRDPRLRHSIEEIKSPEPMTIYDTSARDTTDRFSEDSARSGRADVDLRLGMPFKSLGNYTPATEIDASVNNHPLMTWKVWIVEIPKPDYTGLKLSASDAHTSGDPRLRKIFRLSTEEKDSPASPGTSPKPVNPTPRVDPRRKRAMETVQEVKEGPTYAQQLSTLQSSPFYQSLTSNQKLMLNQELASRNDQSGMSDPIVAAMLSNLGLGPPQQGVSQHTPQQTGQALTILNSLTSFTPNPMLTGVPPGLNMGPGPGPMGVNLNVAPPNMGNLGQGLLGPAPNHMQDFGMNAPPHQSHQMNFDPRNQGPGGMLGNPNFNDFGGPGGPGGPGPTGPGAGMGPGQQNQGPGHPNQGMNMNMNRPDFDDEEMYYDQRGPNNQGGGGGGLGGIPNRDRNSRRGRNQSNRNHNRNNFFRRTNRNRNSPS